MAAGGATESPAVFAATLKRMGLGDLQTKFEAKGWTTMATYAFSHGGFKEPEPQHFTDAVLIPLLGADAASDPLSPKLRHLFALCYGATTANMANWATPSETPPPPMHPEDRKESTKRLKETLKGGL